MQASSPRPRSLSVFFPAYNDGGTIASLVIRAVQIAGRLTPDFEVIVVNDGSADTTAEIADELARTYPQVRVIHHANNRGYGGALRTGFAAAAKDLIAYTDGDAQYDPTELEVLWNRLTPDADMVNGYKISRSDPFHRIVIGRVYHHIVKQLFRLRVRDVDCSFKLFTRPVVDRLELESKDFFIDTEMVARSSRMGARVVEKGVRHYPRTAGHTSVRPSHIPKTRWTVARMWFRIWLPGFSGAKRTPRMTDPAPSRAPAATP